MPPKPRFRNQGGYKKARNITTDHFSIQTLSVDDMDVKDKIKTDFLEAKGYVTVGKALTELGQSAAYSKFPEGTLLYTPTTASGTTGHLSILVKSAAPVSEGGTTGYNGANRWDTIIMSSVTGPNASQEGFQLNGSHLYNYNGGDVYIGHGEAGTHAGKLHIRTNILQSTTIQDRFLMMESWRNSDGTGSNSTNGEDATAYYFSSNNDDASEFTISGINKYNNNGTLNWGLTGPGTTFFHYQQRSDVALGGITGAFINLTPEGTTGLIIRKVGYSSTNCNVGIGTSDPDYRLHIKGEGSIAAGIKIESTANGPGEAPGNLLIQRNASGNCFIYSDNSRPLILGTDNTVPNHLYLKEDGNVGIGTDSPTQKLEVFGGDALINDITVGRGGGGNDTNTAIGWQAMFSNGSGKFNTALGYQALEQNVSSFNNTAVGYKALANTTSGISNTAVGTNSLTQNQAGNFNTAVGTGSLQNNTGVQNTAYGVNTLNNNTSGTDNIAMGNGALFYNKIGIQNVAIGVNALFNQAETTGNDNDCNTAVGHAALYNNKKPANTAVGWQAMFSNVGGVYNTALGYRALEQNVSSISNTAIGYRALANTTSGGNTAVGTEALLANTTANNNTAVGNNALKVNTTGVNNTAIGYQALSENTSGSGNTAVGVQAMLTNEEGTNNTAIGYAAGPSSNNLSNTTSIGYNVRALHSNTCFIGDSSCSVICQNELVVGATGPQYDKLYVNGTSLLDGNVTISGYTDCKGGVRIRGIWTNTISAAWLFDSSATQTISTISTAYYNMMQLSNAALIDDSVSLFVDGNMWVNDKIYFTSDERTKMGIQKLNGENVLQKIRDIECCGFIFKDTINKKPVPQWGFIAQQVKKHLPNTVEIQKDFIADEMRNLDVTWEGNNMKSDLTDVSGVKYRFYVCDVINDDSKAEKIEVVGNSDNTFTFDKQYKNVFCYGKEVEDFHTLDYSKLFSLNFAATQEIDRIQQQEKTKLAAAESRIAALETENADLKAQLTGIEARLAALEAK